MGEALTGDGEGTGEEKEGGSASTPREVPSNFPAVVAPMLGRVIVHTSDLICGQHAMPLQSCGTLITPACTPTKLLHVKLTYQSINHTHTCAHTPI